MNESHPAFRGDILLNEAAMPAIGDLGLWPVKQDILLRRGAERYAAMERSPAPTPCPWASGSRGGALLASPEWGSHHGGHVVAHLPRAQASTAAGAGHFAFMAPSTLPLPSAAGDAANPNGFDRVAYLPVLEDQVAAFVAAQWR